MSFADERRAIEQRFAANWSATAIRYENAPFEQPQTAFVALSIRTGVGRRIDIASTPIFRYRGVIVIDIFVPEDAGAQQAKTLADTAEAIFREATFASGANGSILCRTPALAVVGTVDGWHHETVSLPYQRDQTF